MFKFSKYSAADYFKLIGAMEADEQGNSALKSLDIIDTKASGLAGLIGGFSAGCLFVVQAVLEERVRVPLALVLTLLSVLVLLTSGALCASCLYKINHFQTKLFENITTDENKFDIKKATDRIIEVYDSRIIRFLASLYLFYIGATLLFLSFIAILALDANRGSVPNAAAECIAKGEHSSVRL